MISWIGGKSSISKWIIPHIPRNIRTYVEPFSGAFWVYLKMDLSEFKNLKNVVYNDFNNHLVNLFSCCQDNVEFYNFASQYKAQNKEMFYEFQKDLYEKNQDFQIPDFEVGVKFAYIVSQIWSGISPQKGKFIDLKEKYKSKFDTFKDKLKNDKFVNNLKKITDFENLDFEEVIRKYDSPETFFYLDPPYFKTENYYSSHSFGREDHERLSNVLKTIQGRFALSYYHFDLLEEWFPKYQYNWKSQEFPKASMAKAGKSQTMGTELLIMNY